MVAPNYCSSTPRESRRREPLQNLAGGAAVSTGSPEADKVIRERLLELIISKGGIYVPYKHDDTTLKSMWVNCKDIAPSSVVRRPPRGRDEQGVFDDALRHLEAKGVIERQRGSLRLSSEALAEIYRTGRWDRRPWDEERLPRKGDTRSNAWIREVAAYLMVANHIAA